MFSTIRSEMIAALKKKNQWILALALHRAHSDSVKGLSCCTPRICSTGGGHPQKQFEVHAASNPHVWQASAVTGSISPLYPGVCITYPHPQPTPNAPPEVSTAYTSVFTAQVQAHAFARTHKAP